MDEHYREKESQHFGNDMAKEKKRSLTRKKEKLWKIVRVDLQGLKTSSNHKYFPPRYMKTNNVTD